MSGCFDVILLAENEMGVEAGVTGEMGVEAGMTGERVPL